MMNFGYIEHVSFREMSHYRSCIFLDVLNFYIKFKFSGKAGKLRKEDTIIRKLYIRTFVRLSHHFPSIPMYKFNIKKE